MKSLFFISILIILSISSCTSRLYTGAEYDDLYYLPSDKPVITASIPVNEQVARGSQRSGEYYDNVYSSDTLIAGQLPDSINYSDIVDNGYNNSYNNGSNNDGYEYAYDSPYSSRLRRFYGNYFDPYWRDPFYSGFGYSSFGYGNSFGGYPYYDGFYSPYSYDPYYGYGGMYGGGMYGSMYGGMYGGLFGGYWGFGSYYSPFYSYGGYGYHEGRNSIPYGRRERSSSLSSNWNSNVPSTASGRRDSYSSLGGNSGIARRTPSAGNQAVASDQRRISSSNINARQAQDNSASKSIQDAGKSGNIRSNSPIQRNSANARPEYNSTSRSYTPSYNSPRMSTRPAYNNSRSRETVNPGFNRNSNAVNNSNSNTPRSNSSYNSVERRTPSSSSYSAPASVSRSNSYRSTESYSVPSRRSTLR